MITASDILRKCLAAAEPGGYEDVNYNDSVSAFRYLHRQLPKQANARKVQVAPGRHAIVFKIDVSESSEAPTDVVIVELDGFSTQAEFGTDPRGKPCLYFYGIALTSQHDQRYRDEDDSLCPRTGRDILRVILDEAVKMTDGYLKQSGARKLRSQAAAEPSAPGVDKAVVWSSHWPQLVEKFVKVKSVDISGNTYTLRTIAQNKLCVERTGPGAFTFSCSCAPSYTAMTFLSPMFATRVEIEYSYYNGGLHRNGRDSFLINASTSTRQILARLLHFVDKVACEALDKCAHASVLAAAEPGVAYNPAEAIRHAIYRAGGTYKLEHGTKTFLFSMPYGIALRTIRIEVRDSNYPNDIGNSVYLIDWHSPDIKQKAPVLYPKATSNVSSWRRLYEDLYNKSTSNTGYVKNMLVLLARAYDAKKAAEQRRARVEAAAEPEPAPNFHAYMNETLAMLRQHDIVFSDGRTTTTFRNRGTDAFDAVVKCPERDWERTVLVRLKNESDVVRGRLVSYLQVLRGGTEYFLIPTSIDSLRKWLSFAVAKASESAASAMDLARTRRIS